MPDSMFIRVLGVGCLFFVVLPVVIACGVYLGGEKHE